MWVGRATELDIVRLISMNLVDAPMEEVMRLRALQEISALKTEQLIEVAAVITRMNAAGVLDENTKACLQHPPEWRVA